MHASKLVPDQMQSQICASKERPPPQHDLRQSLYAVPDCRQGADNSEMAATGFTFCEFAIHLKSVSHGSVSKHIAGMSQGRAACPPFTVRHSSFD